MAHLSLRQKAEDKAGRNFSSQVCFVRFRGLSGVMKLEGENSLQQFIRRGSMNVNLELTKQHR